MKKLTQILRLWHTANFWEPTNKDGENLAMAALSQLSFLPVESLQRTISALRGTFSNTEHGLELYMPLTFENGLVKNQITQSLPANLLFYVIGNQPQNLSYSGLNFSGKIFTSSVGPISTYNLGTKSISATSIGNDAVLSATSLFPFLDKYNSSAIKNLIGHNLSEGVNIYDLKIQSGTDIFQINSDENFNEFLQYLKKNVFKTIPLNVKRNSSNTLLKDFPALLLLPENRPKNTIGLVQIPKAALILNENNQANYLNINNFILHLPAAKISIELSYTTNAFENGSKLLLDSVDLNPTSATIPSLPNYKLLTKVLNNYDLYLQTSKNLNIQKDQKRISVKIDPIKTLNITTKTSKIEITKTI